MGGVGLLETPLGVLRSFCFTIAKRGFWLGARMKSVGVNCRGFFGLLFSYPFGLFIPRVLDT